MTFTVLTDQDVKQIFRGLAVADVSALMQVLDQALAQYSCGDEQKYQPHRSVVPRPGGQVSLFMPATSPQSIGVKIVGISPSQDPAALPPGTKPPPALLSALTICDAAGQALGILNAAELTAFRTALGSMLLYRLRRRTGNILVFGAGKQALWHIRLAALLRGDDVRKVTIVNRSAERTQELISSLYESGWPSHVGLSRFDAGKDNLEEFVSAADVIFCTTPSTEPLFPAAFLTSEKARAKSRFISAIGSYRLDMAEIDPELLRAVVDPSGVFSAEVWDSHIAVDSRDGCLQEAGELVTAGIAPASMLEVGQIHQLKLEGASPGLQRWLESGFVVYKSVGIGVMDIAIGGHLLQLARQKGVGLHIPSF